MLKPQDGQPAESLWADLSGAIGLMIADARVAALRTSAGDIGTMSLAVRVRVQRSFVNIESVGSLFVRGAGSAAQRHFGSVFRKISAPRR
jgi:hypothetical protein